MKKYSSCKLNEKLKKKSLREGREGGGFLRGSVSWSSSTRCSLRRVEVVLPRLLPADDMDMEDDTEKSEKIRFHDF